MKSFDKRLYNKKIVMISDFVDISQYTKKELDQENEMLEKIKGQIQDYSIEFEYEEVKTLDELEKLLTKYRPDETIIFNWCEEIESRENSGILVTELLEKEGFIFTGADSECLKLNTSKQETKKTLIQNNIKTPAYKIIDNIDNLKEFDLDFPVIVKYENMHSSTDITNENIVENEEDLQNIVKRLFSKKDVKVLIEEFVSGDEYTISVWGNGTSTEIMSVIRIDYKNKEVNQIQTYGSKFEDDSPEYKNTEYVVVSKRAHPDIYRQMAKELIKTYNVLKFKDFGRFEIRLRNAVIYIIDANANPALHVEGAIFMGSCDLGLNYGETILTICEFALQRTL